MPFRDISYLQLWQPACLAEQSYNLKAILESIMRNISAKYFAFVPVLLMIFLLFTLLYHII